MRVADPVEGGAADARGGARQGMGLVRNVSWSMAATASRIVAMGLALLLLSRMVSPATMGVYGLGWAVATLGLALSQSGAAQGLIVLKAVTPQHVTAARLSSLAVSGSLGAVVALVAPVVERFFELDGLRESLLLAAISIPVMSLSTVDVALLQRNLEFRLISTVQSAAAVVTATAAVLLGYLGFDLIGLFALQGLAGPIAFVCFRLIRRGGGFATCRMSHLRDLWRFGSHLSLGSLSVVFWMNAPQIVIAKIAEAEPLGYFVFCHRMVQLIATQLGGAINTVVYPTFAALAANVLDVGRAYLRTAPYTMLVQAVPLLLLVIVPADFLALYGGAQWVPAAEILRYLALMQCGILLASNVFQTFQAIGRPAVVWQWNFSLLAFQLCVIAAIVVVMHGSVLSVTQGLAATTLAMPLSAWWLMRTVGLPFRCYLASIGSMAVAIAVATVAGLWVANQLPGPLIRLCGAWGAALAVLMFVLAAVNAEARNGVLTLFTRLASRWLGKA